MRLNRKVLVLVIISTVLMFFGGFNILFAEENYPLTGGETVLEKRELADGRLEIFTQLAGEYFKKTLLKEYSDWKLINTEKILLKKTGLIFKNTPPKDPQLSKALEERLLFKGYAADNLPAALDYANSPYLPPVGEQFEYSCVGWSTGYYLRTYQQAREIGWEVKNSSGLRNDTHVFSPSFIYNQINNGADRGASLEDAGDLLQSIGAATLADFPYVPGDYYTQPGSAVKQKAAPHRIKSWSTLFSSDKDGPDYIIQKTKEYLNTGDLVVAGGWFGLNFSLPLENPDGTSMIITDQSPIFGHAFVVVGYDDNMITPEGKGAFKIINSWGKDWGDRGLSYITYQAFTANVDEGCVFTDLLNPPDKIEDLPISIKNEVNFNINFGGSGLYKIEILDGNKHLVNRKSNLQANNGLAQIKWEGDDLAGIPVQDGDYWLNIITYNNGVPQKPYVYDFLKQSKVRSASAQVYSICDVIQKVVVKMVPQTVGRAAVRVNNAGNVNTVADGLLLKAAEPFEFVINRDMFDFRQVDLNKIFIEVKMR